MFGFQDNNIVSDILAGADVTTVNIDTSLAVVHTWSTTQNLTVNLSGTGLFCVLVITCDASSRTLTYGTGVHGAASTLALTASKKNVLTFVYDGTEHVLVGSQVLS